MPEVQSGEVDPKERQEEEVVDQEEDQLGHLGCLSDEGSECNTRETDSFTNNYQPCEYNRHNNKNNQTNEKEREYSSEESSSGLIDPREVIEEICAEQIEVCKANSNSVHTVLRHKHYKLCSDNEEDILTQRCNDLPYRGLKYRQQTTNYSNTIQQYTNKANWSDSSANEGVTIDSFKRSCPECICDGGSKTPKQCLGACKLKKTFALVGHKRPLLVDLSRRGY
jgi:hypothetical protein